MLQQLPRDPDAPVVVIAAAGPVASWVVAAAETLAVQVEVTPTELEPRPATRIGRVIHVVRSPHGQVVAYSSAREVWSDAGVDEVIIDGAEFDAAEQATAVRLMDEQAVIGAAHVRFADGNEPELLVGLTATAAWTLDACATSVYENHVRALLDLPLGSPVLRGPTAMCAVSYAPGMHAALRHCFARDRELRVHLSGTTGVLGMRIGHVTVVADEVADAERRARHGAQYLTGSIEE